MGYSHHMLWRFCEFSVISGNKLMTLLSLYCVCRLSALLVACDRFKLSIIQAAPSFLINSAMQEHQHQSKILEDPEKGTQSAANNVEDDDSHDLPQLLQMDCSLNDCDKLFTIHFHLVHFSGWCSSSLPLSSLVSPSSWVHVVLLSEFFSCSSYS
jgi:hypothetical protein